MSENAIPEQITLEDEARLILPTRFPEEEEFDLPDQTPEDLGKTEEVTA